MSTKTSWFFLLQKVQLEDKTDEGYTALTAASANGRLRVIKELIRSDFKKTFYKLLPLFFEKIRLTPEKSKHLTDDKKC